MSKQGRVVTDWMIGLKMPDYSRISPRVATVLGQNPSPFTGPGTNTYIVGTSKRPLLLELLGQGVAIYADLLKLRSRNFPTAPSSNGWWPTAHVNHLGGVKQVVEKFGEMEVLKMPWEGHDAPAGEISAIGHDAVVHTEGATLRAVSTPRPRAQSPVLLSRRRARIVHGGCRARGGQDYSGRYRRLWATRRSIRSGACSRWIFETIYPAHGPVIRNPKEKIGEYIAHRELRDERQVLEALADGAAPLDAMAIVKKIYVDVPEYLHPAAASSIRSHLKKLEREGRVVEHEKRWSAN